MEIGSSFLSIDRSDEPGEARHLLTVTRMSFQGAGRDGYWRWT